MLLPAAALLSSDHSFLITALYQHQTAWVALFQFTFSTHQLYSSVFLILDVVSFSFLQSFNSISPEHWQQSKRSHNSTTISQNFIRHCNSYCKLNRARNHPGNAGNGRTKCWAKWPRARRFCRICRALNKPCTDPMNGNMIPVRVSIKAWSTNLTSLLLKQTSWVQKRMDEALPPCLFPVLYSALLLATSIFWCLLGLDRVRWLCIQLSHWLLLQGIFPFLITIDRSQENYYKHRIGWRAASRSRRQRSVLRRWSISRPTQMDWWDVIDIKPLICSSEELKLRAAYENEDYVNHDICFATRGDVLSIILVGHFKPAFLCIEEKSCIISPSSKSPVERRNSGWGGIPTSDA